MNRIIFSMLVAMTFFCASAQSPITLGNSNMPSGGDTLRYSNAKLNSIGSFTQTGASFSWNFSTLIPSGQGIRNFKVAFQTPYAFFFFGANEYGEKIADTIGQNPFYFTNYYNFYKKQISPNAYVADGVGLTYNSFPVPNYYSDKDELYNFPMSYPKYDSTTFRFSTITNTQVPVRYSKTGYRVTVVDGWGTVTTPYGTANCLRLVTTQYSKDTVKANGFPAIGFLNYQRSYQWMTLNSKIPYLEISGAYNNGNFAPNQARYRDSVRTFVGIKEYTDLSGVSVFPNPATDKLFFSSENQNTINFEMYDMNGKRIKSAAAIYVNNTLSYANISDLKAGVYMIKIMSGGSMRHLKFIKE
ncbi:MAG: T9SS type A sorting domain-containing protein [Bacteroidetes bacterium]|nr:T9SS type A sorting domain-containing protein [Bacteroidota bacterium]